MAVPVRHIAYLGTPHRGAPLEQVARLGLSGLGRLGEAAHWPIWVGVAAGIWDLCHGYVVEEDWTGGDVDGIDDHRLLPLLPGAEHCFVAATVTGRPGLAGPLGDLFVPYRSATPVALVELPNRGSRPAHLHVGGTRHLELLHHPEAAKRSSPGWGLVAAGRAPRRPAPGEARPPSPPAPRDRGGSPGR